MGGLKDGYFIDPRSSMQCLQLLACLGHQGEGGVQVKLDQLIKHLITTLPHCTT